MSLGYWGQVRLWVLERAATPGGYSQCLGGYGPMFEEAHNMVGDGLLEWDCNRSLVITDAGKARLEALRALRDAA